MAHKIYPLTPCPILTYPLAQHRQLQKYPHTKTVIGGWYDDNAFVEFDPFDGPRTLKMIGVG